ncbi:methyltransferase, TIGR04325 family [Chamaesiphon sp. OTE_75_metabat_556]|uniref:methyltransferase, TIGR04325 family n=1 Tax=Chamaesiphon sp. OTE_75_metabat_556 TaxID=2964692 RepID=UPI00286A7EF0|nr:methyltransferase, TIGR04325 family [Chamaesiphon sp. OTE_75_metabat_556]
MKERIARIPVLKQVYKQWYQHKFANDCYGCFWGVFETFEEAIRAAPATKTIGYNCPELARAYQREIEAHTSSAADLGTANQALMRSFDYPVLYWIAHIRQVTPLDSIEFFDFGGNLGIHFLSYANYLDLPSSLRWIVCDLPEIVKLGTSQNKDSRLTFTTDFQLASGSDIFLASGSLQYDEADIALKINSLDRKPKHLLINRLGLYDGRKIVTLQNGGKVFYPQYIFNRSEFIQSLQLIGYELIDRWEDNVDKCYIPFHPEVNVHCYHGFYFKLNTGVKA